jgi:hypothetical protein
MSYIFLALEAGITAASTASAFTLAGNVKMESSNAGITALMQWCFISVHFPDWFFMQAMTNENPEGTVRH